MIGILTVRLVGKVIKMHWEKNSVKFMISPQLPGTLIFLILSQQLQEIKG